MLTFRTHVNHEAASKLPYSLYLHDDISGAERLIARFESEAAKACVVNALISPYRVREDLWETIRRADAAEAG